ncbi:ATP-binding cassette domain-containing protein [Mycobacterium kansasii]|uniref:ABC transporter ATP-binding/permease protein n=9 Tax=Mycobacterium kansasii TaxID=1768 RepID=A0A653ESG0_MYCKA|nr:ATP-binding cassette domain-containing protein [Mycobacterium kansasii]AGZ52422.1 ABC transporter ATP-binding protein [Mycobacterium kansasii ATCC 12478]ARG61366.1 ABC transporter ATP-binding protein [Mycobacterium kansasii]ARG69052.1 ABC transporter ATP-binding protein [Mycobacterium kansasii]ARG81855.1 ABC transporter ATP-binding protein [Mycobacterium kansasii]ARG93943.1 ABC transporter ATP-binding protein [Mycobacterium kansasii]
MNTVAPPVLTVLGLGPQRTFAAGHDIIVGSDLRADMHVSHPSVSRAHLLLRFDHGRWMAIDNGSHEGTFVDHRRVHAVEIHPGQRINIGSPDGPCLTFEVGQPEVPAGRPPRTAPIPAAQLRPHPAARPVPPPAPGPIPAMEPAHPAPPTRLGRVHPGPQPPPTRMGPYLAPDPAPPRPPSHPPVPPRDPSNLATKVIRSLWPESGRNRRLAGAVTVGRAQDNDIVVPDVLASRRHAFLVQTALGTEIRDARSVNGTYVNGVRIGSAVLSEGDVVTIGNVDMVFSAGTLTRQADAGTPAGGLEVNRVQFEIDGKQLLDNISLTARPGTLTAIIGGSGAGKTTLARLIAGYTRPSAGSITFEGHDIHAEYATLRSRIGMVPQDDVVHRQLTVNQALGYAAELRLPPDTSSADRAKVVARVLEELELTEHGDTRVDKLSGGQRKRASVALELLTGPSLLILDEPTTGLDPALDSQVMMMLRKLADAGRTVVVVTHSVSYLDLCDQLLLLAPGGKTAYFGPPDQVGSVMGTSNWAHIFIKVGADPDEAKRRFLAQRGSEPKLSARAEPGDLGEPVHVDVWRQFSTVARRQVRLVVSDRWYTVFLAALPFMLGLLTLTVPGHSGFGVADPNGKTPAEPAQILVLLCVGAVFMGTALTIRDLVGERPIFHREQAFGLSTQAYLLAKIAVFSMFATAQAAIVTTIAVIGKGAPTRGAVLLGNPTLELFVAVAATCFASAIVGMGMSALARSSDQILPLLVVAIMAQLVFSSGIIPVTNRVVLDQLSWLTPARWGFAASASTIDLNTVQPSPFSPKDSHWHHTTGAWLLDMAMLGLLSTVYAGFVLWRIRLKR